jgi:3-oxoadipate enol-lactonase
MKSVKLFCEDTGYGFPVILLHGYPFDHTIWNPLLPLLKAEARLILPDLRGLGRSPVPDGIYSMRDMACDVKEMMDHLQIKQAMLAGHSMGGYVALSFAKDFRDRLVGLALVASHCFADDENQAKARLANALRVEQTGKIDFIVESMLPNLTDVLAIQAELRKLMSEANPKGVAGILRGMAQRKNSCDLLQNLEKPVVIIAGGKDKLLTPERSHVMAAKMKNQWLEIISDAGHMPMMEAPGEVARILKLLLNKVK